MFSLKSKQHLLVFILSGTTKNTISESEFRLDKEHMKYTKKKMTLGFHNYKLSKEKLQHYRKFVNKV